MTQPHRRARFWIALGSPRAIRVVYAVILLYAVIIGSLMVGYAHVQKCIAEYADANAQSLQIRSKAGEDDRVLQRRVDAVAAADRATIVATQASLADLVQTAARAGNKETRAALLNFVKVNQHSLEAYARNERERTSIAQDRARIDAVRAATPIPGPPSGQC